tara:strand:+ start:2957 stop:4057 length:1101 start_codon:yes stop_codon:yes gene_type:complete
MSKFLSIFILLSFALILLPDRVEAAYYSADLKEAINIECKKSVKEKKYSTKNECVKSIKSALEAQGIVSVQQVPNKEDQEYIEDICVFEIKLGALKYNECIYKAVNDALGIEIVEPPVLVIDDEEKDPETPPKVIPMPVNIQADVYEKVIPSTFYVQAWALIDDEWFGVGSGSAVVILDDTLATNCHVIANENNELHTIDIIHVNDNVKDDDKWIRDVELLVGDFKTDRCIINTKEKLNAPSVNYRNYNDLNNFEEVYAIGNPRGYVGKPSKGQITRLYDFLPPPLLGYFDDNVPLIETNVPIDRGNSGGGLYDQKANLIGITSVCNTVGGAEICPLDDGPCERYCNDSNPQNFSIPITSYFELLE